MAKHHHITTAGPAFGGFIPHNQYEDDLTQALSAFKTVLLQFPPGTKCEITRVSWDQWDQNRSSPTLLVNICREDTSKPKRFWWKWPQ